MPAQPARVLFALHGHDDDPAAFAGRLEPLADDLGRTLVAPSGPVVTAHGRAWFASLGDPVGPPLIETLDALEADARAAGDDVVVVGWSQGAATALALLLRSGASIRPAALVALAPFLPDEPGMAWDVDRVADAATVVHLVHGADDEVVDAVQGRSVRRLLERAGVEVTWTEVAAGHDLGALLAAVPTHLER